MAIEYLGLNNINGPLVVLEGVSGAFYDEIVEISVGGKIRLGRIIEIYEDRAIIQVFGGTTGLSLKNTRTRLTGHPMELAVSPELLGRTFNGIGQPIDGLAPIISDVKLDVNGQPLNPVAREYPRNYIRTGISAIDGLTTLIRGQKLPIFSGDGLPHDKLAAQIVRQASLGENSEEKFAIVFGAMGLKHDVADYFRRTFEESGVSDHVVMFLNLSNDPVVERLITPKVALTAAEYLAYECHMHILVILTDITSYAEAMREVSSSKGEIPSRKGYPGYLYSDLASLYERAGIVAGNEGSVTQIPILTMPNDDITHPIPDLTGYITEGQIILSRALYRQGIEPPVDVMPSLSRLKDKGRFFSLIPEVIFRLQIAQHEVHVRRVGGKAVRLLMVHKGRMDQAARHAVLFLWLIQAGQKQDQKGAVIAQKHLPPSPVPFLQLRAEPAVIAPVQFQVPDLQLRPVHRDISKHLRTSQLKDESAEPSALSVSFSS